LYPIDVARTRLALDVGSGATREFTGIFDCLGQIVKQDGFFGLYRGFNVAVSGVFIYRALFFGLYDTGKTLFFNQKRRRNENPSFLKMWAFAQAITMTSGILTYPFDTIMNRLRMVQGQEHKLFTGFTDCIRYTYAEGGILEFFRGLSVQLTKGLGGAIALVLYDAWPRLRQL
jgi:solute carrier family 25 (adenine nucleotide translocator) protein 4/5/6/31